MWVIVAELDTAMALKILFKYLAQLLKSVSV